MNLTLEVIGPQASSLGAARRKVFGAEGGSIGRLPDNDWVLADPYVSGRHAIIRFVDGQFYIEDTSRNGVFVNSTDEPIVRGRPHPLNSGDRILIDPYEIEAQIKADTKPAAPSRSPLDSILSPVMPDEPFADADYAPVPADPLDALGLHTNKPVPSKGPSGPELAGGSPLWSHYTPPAVEPVPEEEPRELIPSNWLDSSVSIPPASVEPKRPPAPPPLPTPPASAPSAPPVSVTGGPPAREPFAGEPLPGEPLPGEPSPRGGPRREPAAREPMPREPAQTDTPPAHDNALVELFRAAGVKEGAATPDMAREVGSIFRVVVSGVMDVLKARQQTKDQFNLGMTTFKRTDNNPLKFSADVDDALHNLFVKRNNSAYLGPTAAFEDAFADMRNHQIAMLVGVRVAFEAMLSEFHPDHLQEQFDRQVKKGALVSMPARLRYWELYREWIHDMVRDADTSFRELFGDEFARAYDEQLRKLKAQGREGQG
jgi:type VI secretion system FHA domain protein